MSLLGAPIQAGRVCKPSRKVHFFMPSLGTGNVAATLLSPPYANTCCLALQSGECGKEIQVSELAMDNRCWRVQHGVLVDDQECVAFNSGLHHNIVAPSCLLDLHLLLLLDRV